MSTLLVIGAGGHGRVVAEAAIASNAFDGIAFLDDRFPGIREVDGYPVIGRIGSLSDVPQEYRDATVAIGDNINRVRLLELAVERGLRCPAILHPSSSVSRSVSLGDGTVVLAGVIISLGARLGRCCIANNGCTIDHDCVLGDGTHISPGANLAGCVEVGELSWIGIGASVNQGVKIGDRATIGASAAVIDDVSDDVTVIGVPAKPK